MALMKCRIIMVIIIALFAMCVGIVSADVLFEDDFDAGLDQWILYGSPSPRVLPSVEGRTGVFDNNGDSWCESGIVTKDLVSYPEGVIIESDVYLQIANWNGCWGTARSINHS